MGDMRPNSISDYALWPWPAMLDKGERVKVEMRVPNGKLIVFGSIEESPHPVDGQRNKLRFKIDTLETYAVHYKPDKGEPVTLYTSDRTQQYSGGVLSGISLTGWFVVDSEYENVWGLHFEDVQRNREKSSALSAMDDADDTDGYEEPGT